MLFVAALGLLPDDAPVQISQVTVNFIASMQYNTFRQAEACPWPRRSPRTTSGRSAWGWPHSCGTMAAAAMRTGRGLCGTWRCSPASCLGAVAGTVLCRLCGGRAIWGALPLLAVILAALLRADLVEEKDLLEQKPAGH